MTECRVAPYGTWKSPVTSDLIVSEVVRLSEPVIDGDEVYWAELRPSEGGRIVLVRRSGNGETGDVTPTGFNARTRVHEYGGGQFLVRNGIVWSSNYDDQRLYRIEPGEEPVPLTPDRDLRFADGVLDERRRRIYAIREDHTGAGEAINSIVALDADQAGSGGELLASGCDFYSDPRLSPDGNSLAWLQWDHPNMPWDGTELHLAQFDQAGVRTDSIRVAGGPEESVLQPKWSPDGTLYFISDRSGWWNLYRLAGGVVEAVSPEASEFAGPSWVFRLSSYDFETADTLLCVYSEAGQVRLTRLKTGTIGQPGGPDTECIETPFS
ncbi:MAG: hypothetical protein VB858_22210, partial [Planctomycetaceae bacterium]